MLPPSSVRFEQAFTPLESDNLEVPSTLVVTDLDGTLWDRTLSCHSSTLDAVRALQAHHDVELIAATGRRRNSARRAFVHNEISMPAVLLNGAVGFDFVLDELFHMASFRADDLSEILAVLASHDVAPVAYLADTTAVAVEGVTTSPHHLETLEGDLEWWSVERLSERTDVLGLSMLGVDEDLVAGAISELREHPGAAVNGFSDELYAPFSVMIAPPLIDKQRGIEAWLAHRGWRPQRVIAVGDAGNDLAMLDAADIAVVVATASDDVRALADNEIRPPAEGGWADILNLI